MSFQLIQPYDATRKTLKWYRKVVVHLLQVAMVNAFVLYMKERDPRMTFLKFQKMVMTHLFLG